MSHSEKNPTAAAQPSIADVTTLDSRTIADFWQVHGDNGS